MTDSDVGTGKSVLLREIIKSLRKKYSKIPDAVAITASTGALSPIPPKKYANVCAS